MVRHLYKVFNGLFKSGTYTGELNILKTDTSSKEVV